MTDTEPDLTILVLNSGSSSLKFGLYRVGSSQAGWLLSGEAESIGDKGGKFRAQDSHGNALLSEMVAIPSQREAITRIGSLLAGSKIRPPAAIGHRIVHGGPTLRQHCLIDDAVLRQLESCSCLRAAAYASGAIGDPLRARTLSRAAAGSVLRHRLSRRVARGRTGLADPQGTAIARHPTLRVSRPFLQIDRASTWQTNVPERSHHHPSRQWRQRYCGEGRKVHRHQHGINPERRGNYGHPKRRSRSGDSGLSDARDEARCGQAGRNGRSSIRAVGDFRMSPATCDVCMKPLRQARCAIGHRNVLLFGSKAVRSDDRCA